MQKNSSKKDRPKHILTLTREALDLTQAQLAGLAETSIFTIQSVETWRTRLSERIAWKVGESTGIRADWLLSHTAGPLPLEPAALQVKFEEAQMDRFQGFYRAHLLSRNIVYQIAWLLREIANYHGCYAGARHSGFLDGLQKASLKLLKTIPTKDRRKVYEAAAEAVKDRKVRSLIAADMREMDREVKKTPDAVQARKVRKLITADLREHRERKVNAEVVSPDMQSKARKSLNKTASERYK
jgi:hypothetical protein